MYRKKTFMPRKKLYIAKRYSCLTESYASREDIHTPEEITHHGKIFMPQKKSCTARGGIVHLKGNLTPQHQLHHYLARVNAKRIIESN